MAKLDTAAEIDWTACELIEQVPGKVSGRPVVRGTRIMPDPIVNSYELGDSVDEIHEAFLLFPLSRSSGSSSSPTTSGSSASGEGAARLIGRRLSIVVLSTVEWRISRGYLAQIVAAIDGATPGSVSAVDCGTFSRKKHIDG